MPGATPWWESLWKALDLGSLPRLSDYIDFSAIGPITINPVLMYMVLAMVVAAVVAFVALSERGRRKACRFCGATLYAQARFCRSCASPQFRVRRGRPLKHGM